MVDGNQYSDELVGEALQEISRFCENGWSQSEIARRLSDAIEKKIDRGAIFRWLQIKPSEIRRLRFKSRYQIVLASELLKNTHAADVVTFAVVEGASEALPIHLLGFEDHKGWSTECNARVKTLKGVSSLTEALQHLERGNADIALGLPFEEGVNSKVRRLCQFLKLQVAGLFPKEHFATEPSHFAEKLNQLAFGNKIGVLPNANYERIIQRFLESYQKYNVVVPDFVTSHEEAFQKLRDNELTAVVGHSAFISNCVQKIKQEREIKSYPHLGNLITIPETLFDPVTLHLFIHYERDKSKLPRKIRKALHLLDRSINFLSNPNHEPRTRRKLIENINEALRLEASDKMSGERIIQVFPFRLINFDTDLLLELWHW